MGYFLRCGEGSSGSFDVRAISVDHCTKDISDYLRSIMSGLFSTSLFMMLLYSRGLLETVGRQIYFSLFFLSLNFSSLPDTGTK